MRRWADPQTGSGQVMWSWLNDSLGNVLTAIEPAGVSRRYTYDTWGNISTLAWKDSTGIVAIDRGISFTYDGLSRLMSMKETQNGEVQEATAKQYFYDTPSGQPGHLDTQYLLGQLSWARTAARTVFLGYDAFGRLTTTSRSDAGDATFYAERLMLGPASEVAVLELLLPGNPNTSEQIQYGYDSARRTRSIRFEDAAGTNELWRAVQSDVFGRVLEAKLGNGATEHYAYRPDNRRELQSRRTESGTHTRLVQYSGYDGALLLKGLSETSNFSGPSSATITSYIYDARNALQRATVQDPSGFTADTSYAYDGLGNLLGLTDGLGSNSFELQTEKFDRDRLCAVVKPGTENTSCNYRYDALGNVWQIHDTGALYNYDAAGRLRSAEVSGRQLRIDYDPFGSLASLRARAGSVERRESFYGASTRIAFFDGSGNPVNVGTGGSAFQSFVERQITSPQGTVAVVRRANTGRSAILYPVGEYQGTRTVLGSNGGTTQTMSYGPFGDVLSDSGTPNSLAWWPYQWNGGHMLDGFGLVAVGDRVLDGRTGRFLQRDPIMNGATPVTANPYAYAWNNPVKFIDPTGAQPTSDDGGIVTGLAALGKLVYRPPGTPGEKVDAYIEMRWACSSDRDCISAVEGTYELTDFEKGIKAEYHQGDKALYPPRGRASSYHVVMDRLSGALLGYAFFDNNLAIYDRSGKSLAVLNNEAPSTPSWLQPADIIAGVIWSFVGRLVGSQAVRSGATAVETALADDAAADATALARGRAAAWKYDPNLPPKILGYTTETGQIFLNRSLKQGTRKFIETLRHESVHSWLTPTKWLFVKTRQNWMVWFYEKSSMLRYWEEAWAEGLGTRSVIRGLDFPVREGYLINYSPEWFVVQHGLFGAGLYGSYRLGQELRGQWDSR
jgi:RHS repeat-associated protein